MRRFTLPSFLCGCLLAASATAAEVQTFAPVRSASPKTTGIETQYLAATPARATSSASEFTFKDRTGKVFSAAVVATPLAKIDGRFSTLMRAASIAQERAHAHSKSRCWRYVKNALLASGAIASYPKTAYAKQAGEELVRDYGFKKLSIRDPYAAPVGAVLVYGSRRAAGHVEIRTRTGFVSDFQNKKPSPRPLLGVYAKI